MRNPGPSGGVTLDVKVSRALVPLVCAAAGYGVGAFLTPGPYVYSDANGVRSRVNRISGVEQFASSKGWVNQQTMIRERMSDAFGGMGAGLQKMGSAFTASPSPTGSPFPPTEE